MFTIIYKVLRINSPEMPLRMYEDAPAFKPFVLDCGLFGAISVTPPEQMIIGNNVFEEVKGACTEEYVPGQLKAVPDTPVYYWSNSSSSAKLDFVIQHGNCIVPIEVKAKEYLKAKSLRTYVTDYKSLKGIRFSMSDYCD